MSISSYQELMLPVLRVLDKTGPIHTRDCAKLVGDYLGLSEQDLQEMLPSGTQSYLLNRTGWACWYMQQAGLVARPKRGFCEITEEGRKLLAQNPSHIDGKVLANYPSYVERVLKQKAAQVSPDQEGSLNGTNLKTEGASNLIALSAYFQPPPSAL
ncbi:MAG: winged helix-turn-helix domain-containing protein [Verrucomicrobiota bacterium]